MNNEKGVYLVFVSIFLVALLYLLGLAIDAGKLELDKVRLQRASDAGAIVGGSRIGDIAKTDVEKLAVLVAKDNMNIHKLFYDNKNIANYITAKMLTNTDLAVNANTDTETFIIGKAVKGKANWNLYSNAASQKRPVAVVLVLDISGSMNDTIKGTKKTKLDALKSAAQTFVNSFDEAKDVFSLVTFSDNSSVPYVLAKPFSKATLNQKITNLSADGWTNTDSGVKAANGQLDNIASVVGPGYDAYLKVIVLITDGAPNRNNGSNYPNSCPSNYNKKDIVYPILESDKARSKGTVVFSIGIGQQDSNTFDAFQTQPTDSDPGQSLIKRVMLHRLANDPSSGASDPSFPSGCFPDYKQISDKPLGRYLESTDPNDISYMLNQVSLEIQMRLTK